MESSTKEESIDTADASNRIEDTCSEPISFLPDFNLKKLTVDEESQYNKEEVCGQTYSSLDQWIKYKWSQCAVHAADES
jgi:hypothetical protein